MTTLELSLIRVRGVHSTRIPVFKINERRDSSERSWWLGPEGAMHSGVLNS